MARNGSDTKLVLALAGGAGPTLAAKKSGYSARTVLRRLQDESFRREVAAARGRIYSRATSMLARTSIRAVLTLRKLLDNQSDSVKRMAARSVLDALARMSAQAEIEERLAALESELTKGEPTCTVSKDA